MRQVHQNLYIGNASDGLQKGGKFENVISLADTNKNTTHSYEITDGNHDYEIFKEAVEMTVNMLEKEEKTLVHCRAGISRSTSVATAALTIVNDSTWNEEFKKCRHSTMLPHEKLQNSSKKIVRESERGQATEYF